MRRVQFVTISTVAVVVLFMTSSVDCVDCRKYVFAPACRGVWAKRSSGGTIQNDNYALKTAGSLSDDQDEDELLDEYENKMKQKQIHKLHAIRLINQLQKLHRERNPPLPLSSLLERLNKDQSESGDF